VTDEPDRRPVEERILATLETMLANQTALVAEWRRANEASEAALRQAVELQEQSARRGQASYELQQRSVRLYRRVVTVAAALVVLGVGLVIFIFAHG
jgi:hypothetical protein